MAMAGVGKAGPGLGASTGQSSHVQALLGQQVT